MADNQLQGQAPMQAPPAPAPGPLPAAPPVAPAPAPPPPPPPPKRGPPPPVVPIEMAKRMARGGLFALSLVAACVAAVCLNSTYRSALEMQREFASRHALALAQRGGEPLANATFSAVPEPLVVAQPFEGASGSVAALPFSK